MKLFVYGTLKSNKSRHHIMNGATCLGPATLQDYFHLYGTPELDYPLLYPAHTSASIPGELYEVPKEMFKLLDRIEGHPNLYKRVRASVYFKDKRIRTLVYKTQMPIGKFGLDTNLIKQIAEF